MKCMKQLTAEVPCNAHFAVEARMAALFLQCAATIILVDI